MATKTISVDLESYERLVRARQTPSESFSKVIKRARWDATTKSCGHLLSRLRGAGPVDDAIIAALDAAQDSDAPPVSRWTD